MDNFMTFMRGLDWSPLWISLKTGIVATILCFFLGIWAARKIMQLRPSVKAVVDGILTLPMVLPPTVAGFFLLLLFSKRRPLGIFLWDHFQIKVVQSWLGCIIAAICAPIVNTGVFAIGMLTVFKSILQDYAGGTDIVYYFFVFFIGVNFLVEFGVNTILSAAIARIVKAVEQSLGKKNQ